jgi:hypothetical protein
VKPAEVQDFAKREFNPDAMTVVVVGKGSGCKEPLGKVLPKLRTIPQSKLNLDSSTLNDCEVRRIGPGRADTHAARRAN